MPKRHQPTSRPTGSGLEPGCLPVLATTRAEFLRVAGALSVSTRRLTGIAMRDAAFALQLLAAAAAREHQLGLVERERGQHRHGSVSRALLVLGNDHLLHLVRRMPDIERQLSAAARSPLLTRLATARHAVALTRRCAAVLRSEGSEALQCATLAEFAGDLLLWGLDREQAGKLLAKHHAGDATRPGAAEVLTAMLAARWSLPRSEVTIDAASAIPARSATLARAAATDWLGRDALAACAALAETLGIEPDHARALARAAAAEAARDWPAGDPSRTATLLTLAPGERPPAMTPDWWLTTAPPTSARPVPASPPAPATAPCSAPAAAASSPPPPAGSPPSPSLAERIQGLLDAFLEQDGFDNALFAAYVASPRGFEARMARGTGARWLRRHFRLVAGEQDFVATLARRPVVLTLSRATVARQRARLPALLVTLGADRDAAMVSLFFSDRPLGLLYASAAEVGDERVRALKRRAREFSAAPAHRHGGGPQSGATPGGAVAGADGGAGSLCAAHM